MSLRDKISVDDTTNSTVSIDKYSYRREITLRNDGPNRCWIGFNILFISQSIFFCIGVWRKELEYRQSSVRETLLRNS